MVSALGKMSIIWRLCKKLTFYRLFCVRNFAIRQPRSISGKDSELKQCPLHAKADIKEAIGCGPPPHISEILNI